MRYTYVGQASGIVLGMLLIRSAFGPLFIKHLGGSDLLAMLLVTMIGLSRLLQIPISLLVHPASGKRFLLRGWLTYAMIMSVVAVLPFFLDTGPTAATVITLTIVLAISAGMSGTTFWFPMLHDVVPAEMRGRFFGRMRAIWSTTVFIAIIASGLFLGKNPETWRFQAVIAAGIVLVLVRNYFISKVPVAAESLADQDDFRDWKKHIGRLLRRKEVVVFCGYFAILGFCAGFLGPPLVLYMKYMGFPTSENMIIFGFKMLGMVISLLVCGRLVDRIGTKRVFLAAHLVLCMVCFAVVGIGMLPRGQAKVLMPAALILAGAVGAAGLLACTTQLFHLAPDRGRAFFLSLTNILVFAGPAVASLVAATALTAVPDGWSVTALGLKLNIFQVMLAAAGAGLLALIALLRFVQDVRPAVHISSGET